jgi:spore photoproduct lyase
MYESANVVLFVNNDDIIQAVRNAVRNRPEKGKPFYVSISYDTDLVLFEGLTGYCGDWLRYAEQEPNVVVELRTKSAAYRHLQKAKPSTNVILAWTVSPRTVARSYERNAPSIDARLKTIQRAMSDGWQVRLCFDPVLTIADWKHQYEDLADYVFSRISPQKIKDVTAGPLRMSEEHLKRIRKTRGDCSLFHMEFDKSNQEVAGTMIEILKKYFPRNKIHIP